MISTQVSGVHRLRAAAHILSRRLLIGLRTGQSLIRSIGRPPGKISPLLQPLLVQAASRFVVRLRPRIGSAKVVERSLLDCAGLILRRAKCLGGLPSTLVAGIYALSKLFGCALRLG